MEFSRIDLFEHRPLIISGPCSAESEEQLMQTSAKLAASGKVHLVRAGIWKPRTRPGSFEGIGIEALKWLVDVKSKTGLPVAVEVANGSHARHALEYGVDVLWIGARTSVNPFSVQEIADELSGSDATVFVKNPINPDLDLWVGAMERLNKSGITKLAAIHRGFARYGQSRFRNEPQWQIPVALKTRFPDLPIVCDPSHICGNRDCLAEIAQRSLDLNFDGLMIESHIDPDNAWSDKDQQIKPDDLLRILDNLVVRQMEVSDQKLYRSLESLRQEIDEIDDELMGLLEARMRVADEIGLVKKEKGMTILQTNRWSEIIEKTLDEGEKRGLSRQFLTKYLNAVHQESINHQNEIMNAEDL